MNLPNPPTLGARIASNLFALRGTSDGHKQIVIGLPEKPETEVAITLAEARVGQGFDAIVELVGIAIDDAIFDERIRIMRGLESRRTMVWGTLDVKVFDELIAWIDNSAIASRRD